MENKKSFSISLFVKRLKKALNAGNKDEKIGGIIKGAPLRVANAVAERMLLELSLEELARVSRSMAVLFMDEENAGHEVVRAIIERWERISRLDEDGDTAWRFAQCIMGCVKVLKGEEEMREALDRG